MNSELDLHGEHWLPASPERVWQKLNEPEVLKSCIGSCESLEQISETEFRGLLRVGMGPLKAGYRAALTVEPVSPPSQYRLVATLKTRWMGRAGGSCDVVLRDSEGGTLLDYQASIFADGRLAGLGLNMLRGTAGRYVTRFFEAFEDHLN